MDELKERVKASKVVRAEGAAETAAVANENLATKSALLNQKIMETTILTTMVRAAGGVMVRLQDDLDEKECIIKEFKAVIGDDVVNEKVLKKAKVRYDQNYDDDKTATKNKLLRLLEEELQSIGSI